MTDVPFGVAWIVGLYLALLAVVVWGNYAAGTLRHDEDQGDIR